MCRGGVDGRGLVGGGQVLGHSDRSPLVLVPVLVRGGRWAECPPTRRPRVPYMRFDEGTRQKVRGKAGRILRRHDRGR